MTGYKLFCEENQARIKLENSTADINRIWALIKNEWTNLDSNIQNKWIERAYTKQKTDKQKIRSKITKKKISPDLRKMVWDTYIGSKTEYKCFCCWKKRITPFTYNDTFQAGHIISEYNGGDTILTNLLPICRDCNMNMGTENWDHYIDRNNLSLRTYGKNPPSNIITATTIIQSLVRMWLERKNPNSDWLIEWKRRNFYI